MSSQNTKFQTPFATLYLCNSSLNLPFTAIFFKLGILSYKVLDNRKRFSNSSRGNKDLGWKCKIIYRAVIYTVLAAKQSDADALHVAAAVRFPFYTGRYVTFLPTSRYSRNLFLKNRCFESSIKLLQQGAWHSSSIICVYEVLQMFETLCRRERTKPSPSFLMRAGWWEFGTSTVTLWQTKRHTPCKKTGTDSSQWTRKDKRTMDPTCNRTKGKLLLGIREENPALTERVVTRWDKVLCSTLGAIRDSPGKGHSHLSWIRSNVEVQSQLCLHWAWTRQLPMVPSSLRYSMIYLTFRPTSRIPQSGKRYGKSPLWKAETPLLEPSIRRSKAGVISAAHPKFFFLFTVCFILHFSMD